MYLYRIGYTTYEECPYTVLVSDKKYSQDEFTRLITQAIAIFIDGQDEEFFEYRVTDDLDFSRIYSEFLEWFVVAYSFKTVEYTAGFSVFGWTGLSNGGRWEDDTPDPIISAIRSEITKLPVYERINARIKENEIRQEEMMRELERKAKEKNRKTKPNKKK